MYRHVDISFLIITNQDYEQYAKHVVESIKKAIVSYTIQYTYEILIYSPEEIKDDNIIWVKDELKKSGYGNNGYNIMFNQSQGDYIFILNDDHIFPDNKPLKAIEFLKSEVFTHRRFKVTSIAAPPNVHVYGSTCIPSLAFPPPWPLSKELSDPKYTEVPHRHLIMGYPVFERKTVINELCGFICNPSIKQQYSDNWLPFFIGENGEQVEVCKDTSLQPIGISKCVADVTGEQDYYTFTRLVRDFVNGDNLNYV